MAPKPSHLPCAPAILRSIQAFVSAHYLLLGLVFAYLFVVRLLRYNRARAIAAPFENGKRALSSMTTPEAFSIMTQLQSLEFPFAMNKARSVALLKVRRSFHNS